MYVSSRNPVCPTVSRIYFKKSKCFQCFTSLQPLPPFASVCLLLYAQFAWCHMLLPCQRLAGSVTCVTSCLFYLPQFNAKSVSRSKGICFVSVPILSIAATKESQKLCMKSFMKSLGSFSCSQTNVALKNMASWTHHFME